MSRVQPKTWNEILKLNAAYMNAVAIGILAFGIVRPLIEKSGTFDWRFVIPSFGAHVIACMILLLMKPET
ncbi:MAG: hypothetical protein AAFV62_08985 [Pseudomonadota bacterium]